MEFSRYARGRLYTAFAPSEKPDPDAGQVFPLDAVVESRMDLENAFDSLLELFLENGRIATSNRFGSLGGPLLELKPRQLRVPYFHHGDRIVVLTHAFIKKRQQTPRSEIARAMKIRNDWDEWSKSEAGTNAIREATRAQTPRQ